MAARPSKKEQQREPVRKRRRAAGESFSIARVLVPIDFSQHSKNAFQYALSLAKQFHSEVVLVYVVEPTIYPADFSFGQVSLPNIENELRDRGAIELKQLVQKYVGGVLSAKTLVRTGKPFLEILKVAEEEDIDLIIMATHGHTGVEHLLFGGTAEKVLRKAPCPVLLVRPQQLTEENSEN